MEIRQKRFFNKTSFSFGNDKLAYSVKDRSGTHTFDIYYGDIPKDRQELEERNEWYRNVGIFWILIGVVQIIYRYYETGAVKGSIWLTLGVVCFIVYAIAKTKFTIIPTPTGKIFIIQNKQHSKILEEIEGRRKKQLYEWYGEIDFSNDPNIEMAKFKWLADQGVIDENEMRGKINQIILANKKDTSEPDPSSTLIN